MSKFTDWQQQVAALQAAPFPYALADQTPFTWQFIDISGEVVPGFITCSIGFLDFNGAYYPGLNRNVSLPITDDIQAAVTDLLTGNPADASVDTLLAYASAHPALLANVRDVYYAPTGD